MGAMSATIDNTQWVSHSYLLQFQVSEGSYFLLNWHQYLFFVYYGVHLTGADVVEGVIPQEKIVEFAYSLVISFSPALQDIDFLQVSIFNSGKSRIFRCKFCRFANLQTKFSRHCPPVESPSDLECCAIPGGRSARGSQPDLNESQIHPAGYLIKSRYIPVSHLLAQDGILRLQL